MNASFNSSKECSTSVFTSGQGDSRVTPYPEARDPKHCWIHTQHSHISSMSHPNMVSPARFLSHLHWFHHWSSPITAQHIMVVIDWFSKSLCLIPLPCRPSAFSTAELVFNHMFRYFGIPEEIVSDRGAKFTSGIWQGFMKKIRYLLLWHMQYVWFLCIRCVQHGSWINCPCV